MAQIIAEAERLLEEAEFCEEPGSRVQWCL